MEEVYKFDIRNRYSILWEERIIMRALLNMYDSCSENVEVKVGDYVIANINDFGLEKGKKYKILGIDSIDLITVEVDGCAHDYTIEYFNECIY